MSCHWHRTVWMRLFFFTYRCLGWDTRILLLNLLSMYLIVLNNTVSAPVVCSLYRLLYCSWDLNKGSLFHFFSVCDLRSSTLPASSSLSHSMFDLTSPPHRFMQVINSFHNLKAAPTKKHAFFPYIVNLILWVLPMADSIMLEIISSFFRVLLHRIQMHFVCENLWLC